jgi:hypothetical protein
MYLNQKEILDVDAVIQIHSLKEKTRYGEVQVKLTLNGYGDDGITLYQ